MFLLLYSEEYMRGIVIITVATVATNHSQKLSIRMPQLQWQLSHQDRFRSTGNINRSDECNMCNTFDLLNTRLCFEDLGCHFRRLHCAHNNFRETEHSVFVP